MIWLYLAIAGATGTVLRHATGLAAARLFGVAFPWGTLAVNVIGSFVMGVTVELASGRSIGGMDARIVIGTGLLGGFTTYSAFNAETLRLVTDGRTTTAALYVGGTTVLGLVAGALGLWTGRALKG